MAHGILQYDLAYTARAAYTAHTPLGPAASGPLLNSGAAATSPPSVGGGAIIVVAWGIDVWGKIGAEVTNLLDFPNPLVPNAPLEPEL